MSKVLILTGGPSHEAVIARKTAETFCEALSFPDASILEFTHTWQEDILNSKPDFIVLALHGCPGEDGIVQKFLENHHIPYQGSDAQVSALLMNKTQAKALFQNSNLPITQSAVITHADSSCPLDFPVFIKPNSGGSTLGGHIVHNEEEWNNAISDALIYDREILVEPLLTGQEYTVAMWNDTPIAAIQIRPEDGGTYDYAAKYTSTDTDYSFLEETAPLTQELFKLSEKAIQVSGAKHMSRVDFMTDSNGKLYILEINTLPGMSVLYPRALAHKGLSLSELLYDILQEANTIKDVA